MPIVHVTVELSSVTVRANYIGGQEYSVNVSTKSESVQLTAHVVIPTVIRV